MSRSPLLPILLAAALVAQSVIVGWGHSHTDQCAGWGLSPVSHSHHADASDWHQHHSRTSHEHPPLPNQPSDQDDCSVCRHLALAAILTLDLEALAIGDSAEPVKDRDSILASTIAIGLRRPRSPPELS